MIVCNQGPIDMIIQNINLIINNKSGITINKASLPSENVTHQCRLASYPICTQECPDIATF